MSLHESNTLFNDVAEYAAAELSIPLDVGILLDRELIENCVFSVVQIQDGTKIIFIDTVLQDQNGWKHFHATEIDNPNVIICPENILEQSTVFNTTAILWRNKNIEYQQNKQEIIKLFKALPYGITITTKSGKKLKMIHGYDQAWSKIECLNIEKNERFCYSHLDFNAADLKQALSKVINYQPH